MVRARSVASVRFTAILVALCGTLLSAAELPDATAAAKQLGYHVTFQDVVKAVSKSRTRDGYYISFGAAYPKQELSVWVAGDIFFKLPREGGLLGRTVRVSGKVESSPTGPMINLESAEKLEFVAVDPATLSQIQLGGRVDRKKFSAAVRQAIEAEDFGTLEVLGRELHETRERFTDGTWMLGAFFEAFDLPSDSAEEAFWKRGQTISRWKLHSPASLLPVLAEAMLYIDHAWKARGSEAAGSTKSDREAVFQERLTTSRRLLESNPQAKSSPLYYDGMLIIGRGQGWPRAEYFRLFEEAVAREPDYYMHYFRTAAYLRHHGERGDWERFTEEQRQKRGGEEGDALYARIAWSISELYPRNFFTATEVSWETMAAGFAVLMKQHPESEWIKNTYAWFAYKARDRTRLIPALNAVRAQPDMGVWVNLENFEFAERFARGETPSPSPAK